MPVPLNFLPSKPSTAYVIYFASPSHPQFITDVLLCFRLHQSGDTLAKQKMMPKTWYLQNNAVESGPINFAAFLELAKRFGSTSASGTTTMRLPPPLPRVRALGSQVDPALHWLWRYKWGSVFLFLWLVKLFIAR